MEKPTDAFKEQLKNQALAAGGHDQPRAGQNQRHRQCRGRAEAGAAAGTLTCFRPACPAAIFITAAAAAAKGAEKINAKLAALEPVAA